MRLLRETFLTWESLKVYSFFCAEELSKEFLRFLCKFLILLSNVVREYDSLSKCFYGEWKMFRWITIRHHFSLDEYKAHDIYKVYLLTSLFTLCCEAGRNLYRTKRQIRKFSHVRCRNHFVSFSILLVYF